MKIETIRFYNKKTFGEKFKEKISSFSNHIYGLFTIIGVIITFFLSYVALKENELEQFNYILLTLLGCNIIYALIIYRFSLKHSQLEKNSINLLNYQIENRELNILLQLQAETFHNILHYHRSLIHTLNEAIEKINSKSILTQKEVDNLTERNNHFLVMLLSSLQNYFSNHTNDNCSMTIKLLNSKTLRIRTLFRDPVNLKKRRQNEIENNSIECSAGSNTAFKIILDKNQKEIFFKCDNLNDLYYARKYINKNPNWHNYYNSTIVTPISKNNHTLDERHIIGFLSVDNKNGNLVDNTTIEIMWAVSDLLYNYILKFALLSEHTLENKLKNERAKDFTFGNYS